MPTFEIESGGKTYEVEAPDQQTALAALGQKSPQMQPASAEDVAKSGGIGLAKGTINMLGLPGDIGKLASMGTDYLGKKAGVAPEGVSRFKENFAQGTKYNPLLAPFQGPGSQEIQKGVESKTGEFYKPQSTMGEYAQTIGEFAPGVAAGPGGVLRRAATQVLAPALASEGAGQATKGTEYEPYARVGGAIAGGLAPSALGRVVTPLPAAEGRQRLVNILADEGVTDLTAGQRTGSPALRYAESVLGDYPGAGGRATEAQGNSQRQFTEAAMRRTGGGPDAGPEALAENHARLGREFRDLSARNTLTFDQQFVADATQAIRNYERVPPSQQRQIVENYVNDIAAHMQQGAMPGTYYQEMRSRLSRQANNLRNSDPTLSEALRDLRNSLDNAMGRSISPADQEAWQTARQQYGAQRTVEKAASRAGEATAEGQIVPANLRNAVAAENRGAYARGEGQFSELARAGSGIMAPLPQSGTAPRAVMSTLGGALGGMGGLLAGGGAEGIAAALAGAGAPAVAGRALMSAPVQGYLGNQAASEFLRNLNPREQAMVAALMAANSERARLPAR